MQAKLFMIPWIIDLVVSQRIAPAPPAPAGQVLTNDLLVDAHRRHFLEMIRRQQQINDALLLNNALLHPHPLPPLHIPANPTEQLLPPPLFNPFVAPPNQGSTSKLGTYGKEEEDVVASDTPKTSEEKDGTVEAPPQKTDIVKKTLAGVKTVSIQKKGNVEAEALKTIESETTSTTTISPEDLEVVQLFKKLNLSKEETKSIVERVEQVVREKLMSKKLEETTTELPTTTTTTTTPEPTTVATTTLQTTTEVSTTTEEFIEEEVVEEDYSVATTSSPPQMHIRNEENLVLLQRNNLKHHPIKIQEKKIQETLESEEISQGSIKTSLTHLPIFVANEEEDVAAQNLKSSLHKRILIASQDREKENDRDLLVDFATGAPLDLTDSEVTKAKAEVTRPPVYRTLPPVQVTSQPIAPPRLNYHERTDFERLASDYRRRLEHTGDINKILQKISENAYISLVERGGRRKLFGN